MNLSLGLYHGHPRVVLASLEALKELRDPRAIPALLRLAKELAASESAIAHPDVQPIAEALMLCLDRLCGTRVFAARPKMDLKPLLTEGIKVWASKVRVEGLYTFDPELT